MNFHPNKLIGQLYVEPVDQNAVNSRKKLRNILL
jgi:hypothetical protein